MIQDFSFVKDATDSALTFQYNYVFELVAKGGNYPGMTKEETVAFLDAIMTEDTYRWENGGRDKFQEMLNRTFGANAIQCS